MKKIIITAGLLAICPLAVTAAVKTSKPTPLTTTQMQAIKGQAWLFVFSWTNNQYVLVVSQDIGYTGYQTQTVHTGGGPNDGVVYAGYVPPPPMFGPVHDDPNWYTTPPPGAPVTGGPPRLP